MITIKTLEWVENDDMAYNSLFGYHASNIAGRCVLRGPLISSIQTDTLDAAKDAAFADYSARIMSAIEPAGMGVEAATPVQHVAALPEKPPYEVLRAVAWMKVDPKSRRFEDTKGENEVIGFERAEQIYRNIRAALKGDEQ